MPHEDNKRFADPNADVAPARRVRHLRHRQHHLTGEARSVEHGADAGLPPHPWTNAALLTRIVSCDVPFAIATFSTDGILIKYVMRLVDETGFCWYMEKRYSDLLTLHETLKDEYEKTRSFRAKLSSLLSPPSVGHHARVTQQPSFPSTPPNRPQPDSDTETATASAGCGGRRSSPSQSSSASVRSLAHTSEGCPLSSSPPTSAVGRAHQKTSPQRRGAVAMPPSSATKLPPAVAVNADSVMNFPRFPSKALSKATNASIPFILERRHSLSNYFSQLVYDRCRCFLRTTAAQNVFASFVKPPAPVRRYGAGDLGLESPTTRCADQPFTYVWNGVVWGCGGSPMLHAGSSNTIASMSQAQSASAFCFKELDDDADDGFVSIEQKTYVYAYFAVPPAFRQCSVRDWVQRCQPRTALDSAACRNSGAMRALIPTLTIALPYARLMFDVRGHCDDMVVALRCDKYESRQEILRRRDELLAFYRHIASDGSVDRLPDVHEAKRFFANFRRDHPLHAYGGSDSITRLSSEDGDQDELCGDGSRHTALSVLLQGMPKGSDSPSSASSNARDFKPASLRLSVESVDLMSRVSRDDVENDTHEDELGYVSLASLKRSTYEYPFASSAVSGRTPSVGAGPCSSVSGHSGSKTSGVRSTNIDEVRNGLVPLPETDRDAVGAGSYVCIGTPGAAKSSAAPSPFVIHVHAPLAGNHKRRSTAPDHSSDENETRRSLRKMSRS